jgi:hypothetical protein
MISNAKHVAAWWSYRTRHQSLAQHAEKQWLESGQPQPLSLMARVSTAREDNEPIR